MAFGGLGAWWRSLSVVVLDGCAARFAASCQAACKARALLLQRMVTSFRRLGTNRAVVLHHSLFVLLFQ